MPRKYGKKASEKVARTMHEFKRGELRSGRGGKVTARKQAIAIGIAQARRAGYKVPPMRGHASMSLDARVRAYLSHMQPGTEIDARGIARALGSGDPLAADYALESAERDGLAVTSDGRWFGPAGGQVAHARKKSPAQCNEEIAPAPAPETIKLKDRSRGHVWLTVRGGRVVGALGSDPSRYMGKSLEDARRIARHGGRGHSSHATRKSPAHATRKSPAQLDKEIAEFTAKPKLGDPTWEREWSELLTERHSKARMPTIDELARALRYIEREYVLDDGRVDMEQWAEGLAFGRYAGDAEDKRRAREMLDQVSAAIWLRAAERANYLAREQGEAPRYVA